MQISKKKLCQIIKEELSRLHEADMSYARWRDAVNNKLMIIADYELGELGIPEQALKMHFQRGDDPATVAQLIKNHMEE